MNPRPLVSIITPTYNRGAFIGQAIRSVLDQTYDHFELLVVDDGSVDDTSTVIEPFLRDERIRYWRQENQGQSRARNAALAQARGEYIAFLDSDNEWLPHKLERSIRALQANRWADVVYADVVTIDEDGHEISRRNMRRYSGRILPQMLRDNCVSMNTALAHRRCFDRLGGMSGLRRVADDYDLWLRFSAYYQFLYVPEFWARYRVMKEQISTDKTARFESNEAILRSFAEEHGDRASAREIQRGWAALWMRKARWLASEGRRAEACLAALRALRHRPLERQPWRTLGRVALRAPGAFAAAE
jgi:glycosyltransferase involved in cell wall biosynthesis